MALSPVGDTTRPPHRTVAYRNSQWNTAGNKQWAPVNEDGSLIPPEEAEPGLLSLPWDKTEVLVICPCTENKIKGIPPASLKLASYRSHLEGGTHKSTFPELPFLFWAFYSF